MRPFFAWLLLFFIAFQWVGGHMWFKVIHPIEIESRMNETEEAIAEALKAEIGVEAHVKALRKDQINARGFVYGGSFVFSREIKGENIYFTLDSHPVEIVNHEQWIGGHDRKEHRQQRILFEKLFSTFIFNESFCPAIGKVTQPLARNFVSAELKDLFTASILVPPPKTPPA